MSHKEHKSQYPYAPFLHIENALLLPHPPATLFIFRHADFPNAPNFFHFDLFFSFHIDKV